MRSARLRLRARRLSDGFDERYARTALGYMRDKGVRIERGLSENELTAIGEAAGAVVPLELAVLWRTGFPGGEHWPEWRHDPVGTLRHTKDWIARAFTFDIENRGYWLRSCGQRPASDADAVAFALNQVDNGPPLLRVTGHRFMTTSPAGPGNPVLSVWQANDSIYYGYDLADFLTKTFGVPRPFWAATKPPRVPFWVRSSIAVRTDHRAVPRAS